MKEHKWEYLTDGHNYALRGGQISSKVPIYQIILDAVGGPDAKIWQCTHCHSMKYSAMFGPENPDCDERARMRTVQFIHER